MTDQPKTEPAKTVQSVLSNPFQGFLMPLLVTALLAARLMVPTESAPRGDTLWIVQAWFVVALIWSLLRIQRGTRPRKPDLLDAAVWLIVAGHVVSALVVIDQGGDKRAACNMMWEWLALGISFVLLRQMLVIETHRRQLTLGMFSLVFCLSLLGFWQHFVFYQQAGDAYARERGELDRLIESQATRPDPGRELRIQELSQSLVAQGVPLDGQDRILFEQRLQSSTEPFGPFALANTFGALLAGWLAVLLLGFILRRDVDVLGLTMGAVLFGVIAWCLLLTKSRAAWGGVVVGCVGGLMLSRVGGKRTTWGGAVVVLAIVGTLAVLGNGLDREVISEAPKSLKYRLEYWAGSVEVIKNSPVFGSGPGNFRQHYLRNKLPESSEEISDPHNLVLDAWASGGLIAVVGLSLLLLCVVRALRPSAEVQSQSFDESSVTSPVAIGMSAGILLVLAWDWFGGQASDLRNVYLLAGFVLTNVIVVRLLQYTSLPSNIFAAGAVTILVCLLAAGGFGMPAIFQCILVLASLFCIDQKGEVSGPVHKAGGKLESLAGFGLSALLLVLILCCLQTAFAPVMQSGLSARLGRMNLQQGRTDLGLRHLQRAVDFDPIAPNGYSELASVQLGLWTQTGRVSDELLKGSISNYEKSVANDPLNPNRWFALGQCLRLTGKRELLKQAAEKMSKAVELYPNSSEIQSNYATVLATIDDPAAAVAAEHALKLDQLNRDLGHRDRYLPDPIVDELENILGKRDQSEELSDPK